MTIQSMIDQFDVAYPNQFTTTEKSQWLNNADWLVYLEIWKGYDVTEFTGHTSTTDDLLVSAPYDELYMSYMAMQMYALREEIDRYNNARSEFDAMWEAYGYYWSRNNQKEQKAVVYF